MKPRTDARVAGKQPPVISEITETTIAISLMLIEM
jgi:hypothetical protein